ncbi:hypothetical protein FE257_007561 [Aspergillus nanangensis]|uniref:Carrier domain-containing protein n=1 Tax=Aspergillus nanangensis TaxID=2582783 RepID=A0AAD4CP56_ASPNN|nr:hypothetical protein FE257_007561 [Aspergillus nanangensis]
MLSAMPSQTSALPEVAGEQKDPAPQQKPEREVRTVDELIRHRAALGDGQPIISYPKSGTEYAHYPLRQLDVFAFRVAKALQSQLPPRASSKDTPAVIAMLGPSDLNYLVMLLALAKLGHTGLLLSTRISVEAYLSLLERTNSNNILIHGAFKDTAEEIRKGRSELRIHEIPGQQIYDFPISMDTDIDTHVTPWLDPAEETNYIAWIIHSSGSTGLPKPIFHTQFAALKNYAQNMNMSGFITLPLYHNHGISVFFRTVYSCKRLYLYNADLPLTRQYLLDIMRSHELEIFYGVPYSLKLLAETDEGITELAKLKAVMFGGSSCPDSLGDLLVSRGVHLISHYGSTETGQLMTSLRPREDKDWDYVRPTESVKPFLRFEERFPGVFEIICLDGWPSKVMTNRPDGSYAMKDLFTKHPTLEAYKYYARLDDTIVLVNGEKVIPLDLEGRVRQLGVVSEAIAFGSGKASIGLVVVRGPQTSAISDDELVDVIWPSVEGANEALPAFGKLSRNMVLVLPEDTVYPRTDKGTVIKQAFYREFNDLIEKAYEVDDVMTGTLVLSEEQLRIFIKEQLLQLLSLKEASRLTEDVDFFSLGMDSLQATQLRSVILKTIDTNGQKLGLNVAFEHPTIKSLAHFLDALHSGAVNGVESVEDQMARLISKYSQFPQHKPSSNGLTGRYIVVTGATGSLGSHVIAQLSTLEDVQMIYCLVRAASPIEAYDRLLKSMQTRRVYNTLPNDARKKLIALPSDLSDPNLGLDQITYNIISSELTEVIHCAWSVNFNMHLSSFERDNLGGLHNLISLCLKAQRPAPASFNFCSSISAVVNTATDTVPEALPAKLSYAQGMGYAQSKLVAEHICVNAAKQQHGRLFRSRVLRIGQVIGDQMHGIWNATEAIPLMLQSALTIGALPKLDESPLWLPVDVVAGTVVDVSLSCGKEVSEGDGVFNIVSQRPFHWTRDLLPYLREEGLDFEEVGQREWIQRLRASNPDPVVNPPIKLVDFFAGKYDTDEPRRTLQWCTENAKTVSTTLAEERPLDQELVGKMLGYFRSEAWASGI